MSVPVMNPMWNEDTFVPTLRFRPYDPSLPEYFPPPAEELVETDGEKLETFWHQLQIILFSELVRNYFLPREDIFAAGNMFIYFSNSMHRNKDFRGPDIFVFKGVENKKRSWWAVWEEGGKFPDLIIELSSPSTVRVDHRVKKDLHEQVFKTPEYYCYDPDKDKFEGWRLDDAGRYQVMKPDDRGWFWSQELNAWIGRWVGMWCGRNDIWLRIYDREGRLFPMPDETDRNIAEREKARAEAERTRADAERTRAEAERMRAEALERKLAELKSRLNDVGK